MSKKRVQITENLSIVLHSQVSNHCPLCTKPLTEKKKQTIIKKCEIAHIYPLNPTEEELELLKNEELLNSDPNHEDNLIPLCFDCHNRYDKKKTLEEYRALKAYKQELISEEKQRLIWHQYSLDQQIQNILDELSKSNSSSVPLNYNPQTIDEKLHSSISPLTKRRVHLNVQDYFMLIKNKLANLERESPTTGDLISSQIKTFYLAQKKESSSQEVIYKNISKWIMHKTKQPTIEASEIVTSFFIQNCEIFE